MARKLLGCGNNSSRGVNKQFEREPVGQWVCRTICSSNLGIDLSLVKNHAIFQPKYN